MLQWLVIGWCVQKCPARSGTCQSAGGHGESPTQRLVCLCYWWWCTQSLKVTSRWMLVDQILQLNLIVTDCCWESWLQTWTCWRAWGHRDNTTQRLGCLYCCWGYGEALKAASHQRLVIMRIAMMIVGKMLDFSASMIYRRTFYPGGRWSIW